MNDSTKRIAGAGVAACLALMTVSAASAAPVLTNTAAVKAAVSDHVTDVRWRAGPAIAAGAIAGLALGAAAASSGYGYYGPTYYSGAPAAYYYGPPAAYYAPTYAPYYYGPAYDSRGYYRGRVDTNAGGSW